MHSLSQSSPHLRPQASGLNDVLFTTFTSHLFLPPNMTTSFPLTISMLVLPSDDVDIAPLSVGLSPALPMPLYLAMPAPPTASTPVTLQVLTCDPGSNGLKNSTKGTSVCNVGNGTGNNNYSSSDSNRAPSPEAYRDDHGCNATAFMASASTLSLPSIKPPCLRCHLTPDHV